MLSSGVSSLLHVSVCNYKNLLEVRIRISRQACSWIFVSGQVQGEIYIIPLLLCLMRRNFLYCWVVSIRTVGKWKAISRHGNSGSQRPWFSSRMGQFKRICQVYHSTFYQSHHLGRPYLSRSPYSCRQKGFSKGEQALAQGLH